MQTSLEQQAEKLWRNYSPNKEEQFWKKYKDTIARSKKNIRIQREPFTSVTQKEAVVALEKKYTQLSVKDYTAWFHDIALEFPNWLRRAVFVVVLLAVVIIAFFSVSASAALLFVFFIVRLAASTSNDWEEQPESTHLRFELDSLLLKRKGSENRILYKDIDQVFKKTGGRYLIKMKATNTGNHVHSYFMTLTDTKGFPIVNHQAIKTLFESIVTLNNCDHS